MNDTSRLVDTVATRYGYMAGLVRAKGDLKEARRELGGKTLSSARAKLKRDTQTLYKNAQKMKHDQLKTSVKSLRTIDEAIEDLGKNITENTMIERAKVKAFTEIVKELDAQVVDELLELGLYKEITTLPEEQKAEVIVADAIEATV